MSPFIELLLAAVGALLALSVAALAAMQWLQWRTNHASRNRQHVYPLLAKHFGAANLGSLFIAARNFPNRVRADVQRALDELLAECEIDHTCGVQREYHGDLALAECLVEDKHNSIISAPPQYEAIDIGEESPVQCLRNALWLMRHESRALAMMSSPRSRYGDECGVKVELAALDLPEMRALVERLFKKMEEDVQQARSYRGKVLSLENSEDSYSGESVGIRVHKLKNIRREQVILPQATLDLLDRNVVEFVRQRKGLNRLGQAVKKGVLFYGPPGTGKTHTIHYLSAALPEHTTLLISAEQVGLLGEYMTLARLLQPSMVILEDVDLIARDRNSMGACEEVLLNKLLNEMDGLKEDSDILFLLTTNRPETLEEALASRPGRVDQAIEFPLPDEACRARLVKLYSQNIQLDEDLVSKIARRTDRGSAAFIKELIRRSAQFQLERNGDSSMQWDDVENALQEMLAAGGVLNRKLLGASSELGFGARKA